jgi:hypothetical protein
LEDAIGKFLDVRPHPSGLWEAESEAYVTSNLLVRHIEATVELARLDEVLLPSAWSTSRSALEVGGIICWLLEPSDPYEREGRWLARVYEEGRLLQRIADSQSSRNAELWATRARKLNEFADAVKQRLPENAEVTRRIPSAESLLSGTRGSDRYRLYVLGSQYIHGTHHGAGLYRQNLGTMNEDLQRADQNQRLGVATSSVLGDPDGFVRVIAIRVGNRPGAFSPGQDG